MSVLEVRGLSKRYPGFALEDVSFALEPGQIVGFIGKNGAGKSTTLKALLRILHPDGGQVDFFGQSFAGHELESKTRLGFVSGGVDYYPRKKLRAITAVTRSFYPGWDEGVYRRYLREFALDENKTPAQLSAGMRVKYALALALSHKAELLLLDEPTSGLDPISRDDLLDVFLALSRQGVAILFSTHITADLEKCADRILYIKNGRIRADAALEDFTSRYRLAELTEEQCARTPEGKLIGCKAAKRGYTALVRADDVPEGLTARPATLDDVMIHLEKEERS